MSSSDEQEQDTSENVPQRRSRRGQVSNTRSKQQSALETLKEARSKGKGFRAKVDDLIPDVYEELDDTQYQARKIEQRGFVDRDNGEIYTSDSEEDSDRDEGAQSKKEKQKQEERKAKPKKGSIQQMFQLMNKKKVQDENSIKLDNDDVLKECLAELTNTNEREPFRGESSSSRLPVPGFDRNFLHTRRNEPTVSTDIDFLDEMDDGEDDQLQPINQNISARNPFKRNISPIAAARPVKLRNVRDEEEPARPAAATMEEPIRKLDEFKSPVVRTEVKPVFADKEDSSTAMCDIDKEEEATRPIFESGEMENGIRLYYLDAYEDAVKHPSVVYMFGRVEVAKNVTESCCVVVKNVQRQVFFLKRGKDISDPDFIDEVSECLRRQFNIHNFRHKLGHKRFICRNSKLPREGDVLEIHYDANSGRIPADVNPVGDLKPFGCFGKTFSYVFNTSTTALERIVTELEIKGPCWIEVTNAERVEGGVSYCKHEFNVDMSRMKSISVLPSSLKISSPPIRLLSLNILGVLNETEKEKDRQIVMISILHNDSCSLERPQLGGRDVQRYCLVSSLKGHVLPYNLNTVLNQKRIGHLVKTVNDERTLLNAFLAKLTTLDPDIIIAQDLQDQLSLLISRMEKYRLKNWAQLGRLKRSWDITKLGRSKTVQWEMTAGRPWLDLKSAASELVKLRTFEMDELVTQILKPTEEDKLLRNDLSQEQISEPFVASNSKISVVDIIEWNWSEVLFCLMIVGKLDALPLFLQITQIVGGILSRTLMGGRSERNEYLLLHSCHKNKFVAPDKFSGIKEASKKAQYSGGLVLEPKKGLYETFIVLLDFNSLYPSIIQEFNICFTTVDEAFTDLPESELPQMPDRSKPDGILKSEIKELVDRRKEVKNLMRRVSCDSDFYKQYNVRQLGLKLTANSMYGCLGLPQFRFYAKTLAAMITSKGREILVRTKDLVEAEGFSVVYGDTDSIMVNTNCTDVESAKSIGHKLKQIVNKSYNLLELDIDGIYKKLLLLKKKKYAGLAIDLSNENLETTELKGLDIVRRDWSVLAKDIGEQVVDLILSPMGRDELVSEVRRRLANLKDDVEAGRLPLEKYEILKQLTRDPSEYRDMNNQPHALVASRLNATQKFHFKPGDVIKYIICLDGSTKNATQRAYHPSEIVNSSELAIDTRYYLEHQVNPVVARLCEPIEELAIVIADSLGLHTTRFHSRLDGAQQNNEEEFGIGLEQDFEGCEGFSLECFKCGKLSIIRNTVVGKVRDGKYTLEACSECSAELAPHFGSVLTQLILLIKAQIRRNIQCPFVCDDVACGAEVLVPSPDQWTVDGCICLQCQNGVMRKSYSCKQLFDQQCFYKKIFDLDAFLKKSCTKEEQYSLRSRPNFRQVSENYKRCLQVLDRFLSRNDFNKLDLGVVFAPLFKFPASKV